MWDAYEAKQERSDEAGAVLPTHAMHDDCAATVVPHKLAADGAESGCAKSPAFAPPKLMLEIVSAPSPVLLRVTLCAALDVPTSWPAKLRLGVDRLTAGAVPVPVRATSCGLPGSLSVMVSVPVRVPVWVGLNWTRILQLAWDLIEGGHSLRALKSPVAVALMSESDALP